jgi:hypothetical protein
MKNKTFYIFTMNQMLDGSWVPSIPYNDLETYIFYGETINSLKNNANSIALKLNKHVGIFNYGGETCFYTSNPNLRLSSKYVIDKRKEFKYDVA